MDLRLKFFHLLLNAYANNINSFFFQIKIHDENPVSKEFIIDTFKDVIDKPFIPLGFHFSTTTSRFFIENDSELADALCAFNRRVSGPSGKLIGVTKQKADNFLLLNSRHKQHVIQVSEK